MTLGAVTVTPPSRLICEPASLMLSTVEQLKLPPVVALTIPPPLTARLPVESEPPESVSVPPASTLVVPPTTKPLTLLSVTCVPRIWLVPIATLVGPVVLLVKMLTPDVHAAGSMKRSTVSPVVT